jgi:hypothetical protein
MSQDMTYKKSVSGIKKIAMLVTLFTAAIFLCGFKFSALQLP